MHWMSGKEETAQLYAYIYILENLLKYTHMCISISLQSDVIWFVLEKSEQNHWMPSIHTFHIVVVFNINMLCRIVVIVVQFLNFIFLF